MVDRPKKAEPRPAPRLYLVTPPVAVPADIAGELAAALASADIAAVLLRLADADERTLINHVKMLAAIAQQRGAALILDGHAELAARAGADGAHMAGIDAFMAARDTLKPDRIAGVGRLASRHDCMQAAEAGADYVMFGEPDGDARPAFTAIEERVAWWAEVFETPCVAFAAGFDDVAPLVRSGADFIALDYIWRDPRGVGAALTDTMGALRLPEGVA